MGKEVFKYYAEIKKLNLKIECPSVIECDYEIEAYRFTSKKEIVDHDFIPQALKSERPPKRFYTSEIDICNEFGLSFFNNIDSAKGTHNSFSPKIKEKLGYNFIAKGLLNQLDGVITEINSNGHFNLHEYKDVNLKSKFSNCAKL